jgi:hypothetical protein
MYFIKNLSKNHCFTDFAAPEGGGGGKKKGKSSAFQTISSVHRVSISFIQNMRKKII